MRRRVYRVGYAIKIHHNHKSRELIAHVAVHVHHGQLDRASERASTEQACLACCFRHSAFSDDQRGTKRRLSKFSTFLETDLCRLFETEIKFIERIGTYIYY